MEKKPTEPKFNSINPFLKSTQELNLQNLVGVCVGVRVEKYPKDNGEPKTGCIS